MQENIWYNVRVPKTLEKKSENFSLKMPESLLKDLAEISEYEDRPLGYVGRELMIGGGKLAGVRFARCVEIWLEKIRTKVAPRTLDGYEGSIRLYALPHLKNLKLGKIRDADIEKIYEDMGRFSPTTVRNLHAALRTFFSWAVRRKDIRINPCKTVESLPAKVRSDIIVLDEAETTYFISVCREMPHGLIFEFALQTGMRPEEYLALRWSDLSGNDAMVQQAVQFNRKGGGYYFKDTKTRASRRRVPVSDDLRRRLGRHRFEQNEHRLAMRGTWFNHDLIFPNEIGRPYPLNNLTRRYFTPIIERMWPATELPDGTTQPHPDAKHITLYSLRHTCATLLLMLDENPKVVADRLGSSVKMILETYSHVLPHIQAAATEKLARVMR